MAVPRLCELPHGSIQPDRTPRGRAIFWAMLLCSVPSWPSLAPCLGRSSLNGIGEDGKPVRPCAWGWGRAQVPDTHPIPLSVRPSPFPCPSPAHTACSAFPGQWPTNVWGECLQGWEEGEGSRILVGWGSGGTVCVVSGSRPLRGADMGVGMHRVGLSPSSRDRGGYTHTRAVCVCGVYPSPSWRG